MRNRLLTLHISEFIASIDVLGGRDILDHNGQAVFSDQESMRRLATIALQMQEAVVMMHAVQKKGAALESEYRSPLRKTG